MAVEGFRLASELRPHKHTHFTCLGKVYLRWGGHDAEALGALVRSLQIERTSVASNLATKARVALARKAQVGGFFSTGFTASKKQLTIALTSFLLQSCMWIQDEVSYQRAGDT